MTPGRKLKIANVLSVLGVCSFVLGVWFVGLMFESGRKSGGGLSDVLIALFLLAVSYLLSVLISGGAAIWSSLLLRKHIELRTKFNVIAWKVIPFILCVPPVLFLLKNFHSFGSFL